MAPVASAMCSTSSSAKIALMMAKPPGSTGDAVVFQSRQVQLRRIASLEQSLAQALQTLASNARVAPAAGLDDVCHRARGAGGPDRLLPVLARKLLLDGLQFDARGGFGVFHVGLAELAVGKKLQAVAHATHVQAFQPVRLVAGPDDELGGSATDIDYQRVSPGRRAGCGRRRDRSAALPRARRRLRSGIRVPLRTAARIRLRSWPPSAYWCRPRAPPRPASRAGARRSVSGTRWRGPAPRHRDACPRSVRPQAAPVRARNRGDRSGRRPRGRPGAGRNWSRDRQPQWWRRFPLRSFCLKNTDGSRRSYRRGAEDAEEIQ